MSTNINGWVNIYKPRGISSAKAVAMIKRFFPDRKIGHTGTLDLEAEGVLPIAIGEATKLSSYLVDTKKQYRFQIKFGARTDSADSAGKIIETTNSIPTRDQCMKVCSNFLGEIEQTPPIYSAIKVNGQRAYKLARSGQQVEIKKRNVHIFELECIDHDHDKATYVCLCSKGTYIRSLAEDISLCLQSLGYVIELARLKVGDFSHNDAINFDQLQDLEPSFAKKFICDRVLKTEIILDDIPVLDANQEQCQKILFGQKVCFEHDDLEKVWIRDSDQSIVAIGSLHNNEFQSSRVFNK